MSLERLRPHMQRQDRHDVRTVEDCTSSVTVPEMRHSSV